MVNGNPLVIVVRIRQRFSGPNTAKMRSGNSLNSQFFNLLDAVGLSILSSYVFLEKVYHYEHDLTLKHKIYFDIT